MDSQQNRIWGPALWMVLHSAAAAFKDISLPIKLQKRVVDDEKRIWLGLLLSLRYSLPCPMCKKHYTQYLANHPPVLTRDGIQKWLYDLHHDVNVRNGKESPVSFEHIAELGYDKTFACSQLIVTIHRQMLMALRIGWSIREDIQRTFRFLEELRRYYGFP